MACFKLAWYKHTMSPSTEISVCCWLVQRPLNFIQIKVNQNSTWGLQTFKFSTGIMLLCHSTKAFALISPRHHFSSMNIIAFLWVNRDRKAPARGETHSIQNELTIWIVLLYKAVTTLFSRCSERKGRAVRCLSQMSFSSSGTGFPSQSQAMPYQSSRSRFVPNFHRVI